MNFALLWHFVRQDFADRFSGAALGRAWLLLTPLVQILIFIVIFGELIGPRLPGSQGGTYGYGVYLVSGILPWTAFANTISRMTTVFFDKRGILSKVPLSLTLIAIHIAIVEAITLACTLGLFTVLAFGLSVPLTAGFLALPVLILCQQLLAFSLGLIGAILMVFLRDVREITGVVLMLWFWMVPIVYTLDSVPHFLQTIQVYNPAWWFVREYHQIFVFGAMPDIWHLVQMLSGGVLLAAAMIWLLSKSEHHIRDAL
ncbi:MAG: ABC transporter permease [Alphaproteobacteria bacterium]